jgi:hypothetical protein
MKKLRIITVGKDGKTEVIEADPTTKRRLSDTMSKADIQALVRKKREELVTPKTPSSDV